RFADLLAAMGCDVERTATAVTVTGPATLSGIDVDMADVSDLVPTIAVVATKATSPTRIRGVGFIRAKESDRLGDLARELQAAGADVEETADGLAVRPSTGRLHGAALATHHDHRLAMAFAVLGSVVDGIEVRDPDVVSKSWPGFWQMLDESFR
ncbi:MAG: 3-phosphoshikimate 1-carboxyvinyltransferase, partial [Ilumatobacter sp.]|nr:3-phosphoshikimate 1-carboxyvinyltransferase [Ilumatobacter sp.]